MKKSIYRLFGLFGAAALFTSCGSDSNRNSNNGAGPANANAFVGTTVSFNPTITFRSGGIIEFVNEEDPSEFDFAPASDPTFGTYSYVPADDFLSGILTLRLEGDDTVTVADLTDFEVVNGFVTGFTITFQQGLTFQATVDSGSLAAAEVPDSNEPGDGGGSGGDDFTLDDDGSLAAGTSFSRSFVASNPQGDVSDSPLKDYSTGETVDFIVAGDGSLVFDGVDGPIALGFAGATNGILNYQDEVNGGAVSATLNVSGPEAESDFSIIWTKTVGLFNPTIVIDNKVFVD